MNFSVSKVVTFNFGQSWLYSGTFYCSFCGFYIIDVESCTKNLNSNKQTLGKKEIIVQASASYYNSSKNYGYNVVLIPILGNLVYYQYPFITTTYASIQQIATAYGCTINDIEELDQDQFNEWLYTHLLQHHIEMETSDATKINYTDGTYDIIRSVLTESQAKDYAYNQLLNTYGTFYKANEIDISGAYRKQI